MGNNSDMVNIKKLIDVGKDKGYITYNDLNGNLSEEFISSEENSNDLMTIFQELDIVVVDEETRKEIRERERKAPKPKIPTEPDPTRIEIPDTPSRVSDPVKLYLREMGAISLLTREGEVEIAKRIEKSEKEVLRKLLDCSIGIEHVIELGDQLRAGKVKLREVINDLEEDYNSYYKQLGEKRETLLTVIDEIKKLYEGLVQKKAARRKSRISKAKKEKLSAEIKEDHKRIITLVESFRLEKSQLELMVERLSAEVAIIEDAERQVAERMMQIGGKSIQYLNKCAAAIPKSAKGDKVMAEEYLRRSVQLDPYQPEVAEQLGRMGVAIQVPRKKESGKAVDKAMNEQ